MEKCNMHQLSPSYANKKFKCRCDVCLAWKKEAANRTNDKELARQRAKEWRLKNLERSRQNSRDYQRNHPEKLLDWKLKRYGITAEQYLRMVDRQNGRCAICGDNMLEHKMSNTSRAKRRLSVDHDKNTGKIRGLLCGSCNVGIGLLQHDEKILKSAIIYLNGGMS